jgi:diguanylate cyclase (GGDEF)-like protein/PAS domain S-box-containing protein
VIGEGIYVLDGQGRLTFMNPEAQRLLGWTEAELLGREVHEVIHFQKDGTPLQATECPELQAITCGGIVRHEEDVFKRKDGTLFPVALVATPLLEDGRVAGSVAAFHDITDRKKVAEELKLLNDILAHRANTDPLTGISNRLKFNEILNIELQRAKRFDTPLSLIMFDVDHFKEINDTFGHHTGDEVLRDLTKLVAQYVRSHDLFARWGGEEFMIMVTNTAADNARHFAEKLRLTIESRRFPGVQQVTCSFGVAQLGSDDNDDRFTQRVDRALYLAKAQGRNRVELACPWPDGEAAAD